MILGLSVATFTLVHVIINLIAIATGFVVMAGLVTSNACPAGRLCSCCSRSSPASPGSSFRS